MPNVSRMFCAVAAFVVLLMFNSCYAGKVTISTPLEIKGSENFPDPTEYEHAADPKVQLSITLNGVRAEGYTKGLIMAPIDQTGDELMRSLSGDEIHILAGVDIFVSATCMGSGKNLEMKPGMTLVCDKGDGLDVMLFKPKSPGKWGVFTLTETRDVDDEQIEGEKWPTQQNITDHVGTDVHFFDLPTASKAVTTSSHHSKCCLQ